MKVLPIYTNTKSMYAKQKSTQKENLMYCAINDDENISKDSNSLTFKQGSLIREIFLAERVKKTFWDLIMLSSRNNMKKNSLKIITNTNSPKEQLVKTISTIGKISNQNDKIWGFSKYEVASIKEIKELIFQKAFPRLDDANPVEQQIKKDYMENLVNSGDYATGSFYKTFKNLDNNYYEDFKENLIKKLVYSEDHEVNVNKNPNLLVFDRSLLEALEPSEKRVNYYNTLTEKMNKIISKMFESKKDLAYECFNKGFSSVEYKYNESVLDNSSWVSDINRFFYKTFEQNVDNFDELNKKFNIKQSKLEELNLDVKYILNSQKATNEKERLNILAPRIREKIEFCSKDLTTQNYFQLINYIKMTNFKTDFYPKIKADLESLGDQYVSRGSFYDYENYHIGG